MTSRSWRRVIVSVALLILALSLGLGHKGSSANITTITPQRVLSLLDACNKVGGDYPPGNDKPATSSVCELGGIIYWNAGMTIDCDGVVTKECSSETDPDFRGDTTLHDSRDRPLDAAHLPYVVAPFPDEHWNFRQHDIRLGAVAAIIYRGRIQCGVLGDLGTIGEASYAMAKNLDIDPDPHQGGTYSKMTYIIFKHSRIFPVEDHAKTVDLCMTQLAQFVRSSEQKRM